MKKYLILLIITLFTKFSYSQVNYQDVVYLKNGSIVRGIIIEQVPNKLIKIETSDKSIFVFQIDEIEKITKEPFPTTKKILTNTTGFETGFKRIFEMGSQIAVDVHGKDRFMINFTNAYQINPYFSAGIGTGLRFYFENEAALIPVFADLRTNFINKKASPYLSAGIGYSFDATGGFENVGFFLNPTAGFSFKFSNKLAMNIAIGCEMQRMRFYRIIWLNNYPTKQEFIGNSGAFSVHAGLSF